MEAAAQSIHGIIETLLDALFGCRHRRLGWPMRLSSGIGNAKLFDAETQSCLDCGKRLPYNGILAQQ